MACHRGSSERRLDTSAWVRISIATRFFTSISVSLLFLVLHIALLLDSSAPAALRKVFMLSAMQLSSLRLLNCMALNINSLIYLLAFLLFEDAAQDFAGGVARDGIDIFYLAHVLVGRQLAIGPRHQFVRVQVRVACSQDYKGFGYLARLLTGFGDDCHIGYGGMFQQQGFQLGRGDAEALVFNQLLFAISDGHIALFVAPADVSRVEPTVTQRLRRCFGG